MTEKNLDAFALAKGIKVTYQQMDQASQTALRYAFILARTKDMQGDYVRTYKEFANQKKTFVTNLSEIGAKLAEKLIPNLAKGLLAANNFMDGLLNDPGRLDKMAKKISDFANSTVEFGKFVIKNGPEIVFGLKLIGISLLGWTTISALNTTYKTVVGIAGFIMKSIPIIKNFIQYQIYLRGLYAKDAIVMAARTVATWAMVAAQGALNIAMTIGSAVASGFGAVMAFLTSPIGLVILAITAIIGVIYLLYKNWDTVTKFLGAAWQNNVVPVLSKIGDFFSAVLGGVASIFKGYINTYINLANFLIKGLNKIQFTVPDWVPGVGGKFVGINIPLIPTFANGGFANTASIFGEAGMEAAIPIKPKSPRSISLLNQTARMLGVGGSGEGNTYNFNFSITGGNAAEIRPLLAETEERIRAIIEQVQHDQGRESFA